MYQGLACQIFNPQCSLLYRRADPPPNNHLFFRLGGQAAIHPMKMVPTGSTEIQTHISPWYSSRLSTIILVLNETSDVLPTDDF